MKTNIRTLLLGVFSILAVLILSTAKGVDIKAAAITPTPAPATTSDDFYFVYNSSNQKFGSDIELKRERELILLKSQSGNDTVDKIRWISSNEDVIEVTPDLGQPLLAEFKRVGPGYSMITAIITRDSKVYSVSVQVEVKMELDDYVRDANGDKIIRPVGVYNTPFVIMQNIGDTVEIPLKYVSTGDAIKGSQVAWEVRDESNNISDDVVSVKDGVLTANGAGKAFVTLTTKSVSSTGLPQSIKVIVIVKPKASKINDPATMTSNVTFTSNSSNFTIYTNAKNAENMDWKVYSYNDLTTPLDLSGNKLVDVFLNRVDGSLVFTNAKAGTYKIKGYSDEILGDESWNLVEITVVVPVVINISDKVMNVGDTFNILENSNIADIGDFAFTINEEGRNVISVHHSKGIVTAKLKGEAIITMKKADGTTLTLPPDPNNPTNTNPTEVKIKVRVIDGLSLSTNNAIIYIGGTIQLEPISSDMSKKIDWRSSDDLIATVKDGLVTGVKEGEVTIYATQTIDGVTKTATSLIYVQSAITKITIDPPSVTLNKDEYATLYAKVDPSTLSNVSLKWISTNTNVVAIENFGKQTATIKAVGGGTAVVIAVNQDNVVIGSTHVTVKQKVISITLSETNITANQSQKIQLRATVAPDNAHNKDVTWKSTNNAIATVDSNGMVTIVGSGQVSIIATSVDNPAATAIANITVGIPVSNITLDATTKTLYVGETTRVGYVIAPTNATNKAVTWSSTHPNVASVDGTGLITPRSAGITIITVKTADGGKTQSITVTVKQKATSVTIEAKNLEVKVGETISIPYKIMPENATDVTMAWESSNTSIVSVNEGKITGVSAGTATVVLKAAGSASLVNIKVIQEATGMKLNYTENTVVVGEKFKLRATLQPNNATNPGFTFKSSNPKVAKVTIYGNVYGLKGGTAIITVTTKDGKLKETVIVHVKERVTSISLNKYSYRLGLGKTFTLKAKVKTNAATNPKVRFESSNPKVATVNQSGKITGRSLGYTTIRVIAQDGSNVYASSTIRVVNLVSKVTLNRTSATTVVGRTLQLKATVSPKKATYKTVYWKSSDESIAVVDDYGLITALKPGNVVITATAKDSGAKTAKAYIIVQPQTPATSVTILNQNMTMVVGETNILQKAINPTNSTDRFTWESDNKIVASVNRSTGKVTAKSPGIANITVMTESGKTATTKVTVVGLNQTRITLEQYSTYTLSVIGINSGVTWDIADNEIAVVRNGRIESRRVGTTTITATVNGRKLTCRLTVTKIR